jgi:hypothetical protein
MKEDRDSFIEDLADNTPNEAQFDKLKESDVKEVEEDLLGGKSFKMDQWVPTIYMNLQSYKE